MPDVRKAALDVGSNSVLLLVEEFDGIHWRPLLETTAVTSLGENVKSSGILSDEAMTRTLRAIRKGFDRAHELGVVEVSAAVTMAGRLAKNSGEFMLRAAAQGTPIFILSGEEEAELGFRSVAHDEAFGGFPRLTIIDVGGQSTELTTADRAGRGWLVRFRRSFPIGTLALLSGTLRDEKPDGLARLRACKEIDDVLGLCYLPGLHGAVVSLGATGTNLVSIREALGDWDPLRVHGASLTYEEISESSATMFDLSYDERSRLVGIEQGREKTLPIGALILERFLHAVRAESCFVSVRGWRHALLEEGLPAHPVYAT